MANLFLQVLSITNSFYRKVLVIGNILYLKLDFQND